MSERIRWRDWLIESVQCGKSAYSNCIRSMPNLVGATGRIESLMVAPVKAFGGIFLREAIAGFDGLQTVDGLLMDRMVMLARKQSGQASSGTEYTFVRMSQRDAPQFALTRGAYDDGVLQYTASSMSPLCISPVELVSQQKYSTKVLMSENTQEVCPADVDDESSVLTRWVREFLRIHPVRGLDPQSVFVLRAAKKVARRAMPDDLQYVDAMQFTDGSYGHSVSCGTNSWMNALLKFGSHNRPIDINAFRGNVALGKLLPNAEDLIRQIAIDGRDWTMDVQEMTVRCPVPGTDAETGTRPDNQPQKFLIQERPPLYGAEKKGTMTFGFNWLCGRFDVKKEARIAVGDSFTILSEREFVPAA